jgi:hypothetical protein
VSFIVPPRHIGFDPIYRNTPGSYVQEDIFALSRFREALVPKRGTMPYSAADRPELKKRIVARARRLFNRDG